MAWAAWPRQKIVCDSFRLAAFGAAVLQMAAFPQGPGYDASEMEWLVAVAGSYTLLKIAQPFRWQRARATNLLLLAVDIVVSALLVHYSGSIESPFILYTLLPVLTASLLKDSVATALVSIITASYVLIAYVYNSTSNSVLTLQAVNDYLVYIIALGLVATLPYAVNLTVSRRLRSGAAAEERLRISHDLHDNVCQALCGLRWQVQHLAEGVSSDPHLSSELKKMEAAVETAENDARELLKVLHAFSDDVGFTSHLKHHLEQLKQDIGIEYELDTDDAEVQVKLSVEHEILMICVEALTNVRKHAGAKRVWVSTRTTKGRLQIRVADDGVGFENSAATVSSGYGLSIMRERAASVGGTLRIASAPGEGTEIQIEVPAGGVENDI